MLLFINLIFLIISLVKKKKRQDPTKVIYSIFAEGLPLYFEDIDDGKPMPKKGSIITPEN